MYVDFQSFSDGTQISITLSAIRDALHRGVRQKFGECWIVLARLETVERTRSGSSNSEWLAASKRKFCRRCLNPWVFKFHRTSRRHFLLKSAEDIVPLTAQCAQIESLLRSVMVIFSGRQIIQSVTEVVSSPASSRALPSLERLLVPCLWFAIMVQPPESFELTWRVFSLARSCAISHVSIVWPALDMDDRQKDYPSELNQNAESIQPPLQRKRQTVQLPDTSKQSQSQGSVS